MARRNDAQAKYDEGQRLLRLGAFKEALAPLKRALELDPEHAPTAKALGYAYSELRVWTRAVDSYRETVSLAPKDSSVWIALGEGLLHCGCAQAALDAFERATELAPRNANAWMGKGRSLRSLDDSEGAIPAYRQAAYLSPDDFRAIRGLAACLESLGRHAEVVTLWDEMLQRQPDAAVALRGREAAKRALQAGPRPEYTPPVPVRRDTAQQRHAWALALASDGRISEALSAMRDAIQSRDDLTHGYRDLGTLLEDLEQWEGAVEAFRVAMQRDPTDVQAIIGLIHALRSLDQLEDAKKILMSATEAMPDNAPLFTALGELYRQMRDYPQALTALDRALELNPHSLDALVGRGATLEAQGALDKALPVWRRVLRIAPDHPMATRGVKRSERHEDSRASDAADRRSRGVARIHFDLGKSMLQQGRHTEAVASFQKAVAVRDDWAEPWFYMGVAHTRASENEAAENAFRQALRIEPTSVEAACHLGDLARSGSRFKEALEAYDMALAHTPSFLHALSGRAESLRMLNRRPEAIEAFELALRQDPKDFVALCGLAALLTGERRYSEARALWDRARVIDPKSAFVQRGIAECNQGKSGTALVPRKEPAKERSVPAPPSATPYDRQAAARQTACDELDRGRSFHKERNYAAAISAFSRALELDQTFAEAALRLGMAYEDDRQFRRAIRAYERCLDIESTHFQAATNIGEAHRKNERYLEAIQAYDRALEIKPDYLYALAGRAECMRMLGRYEESLDKFDKALEVGPNHAFAIQGKAATLNALQRFEEARELWDRALDIEPTSQFAKDGKGYCEAQLKRRDTDAPAEEAPATESSTPTLDEQGRDLTALAAAGALPMVIGRENEIRAVMKTLVRRLKANPLLLGEPGVGKTAVVEGVAQKLQSDDKPARLEGLRIVELSMGTLVAGTKYRGTFEERLREIVKEAKSAPGIVLFIDEIHTLVGAGRTEGGSLDAANILKPALARGEITVIGATTNAEFRRHFESDSALERRFQPIQIDEPSEDECIALLNRIRHKYETHHEVKVQMSAVEACVKFAIRYVPDRRLPDKALDLLDEACAEASLSSEPEVHEQIVARVVSERTGVAVENLTEAERTRMNQVERHLEQRVVGQDNAVATLANAVRLAKAGLRVPDRPRGVFLFQGPSGVGKTELAKALSDFLFPEGDALIRLDMSEYSDRFTSTRLLGAPPGYSGHGEEGQLSGPLRKRPYSVVLLDEFEKAHPDVQAVFLSLLDEGQITDSEGRQVNAREAFFILTTNAGAEKRGVGRVGFGGGKTSTKEASLARVKPFFRPELLNRIDEVVVFDTLDQESLEKVALIHLEKLASRISEKGVRLTWRDDVVASIAEEGGRVGGGARPVIRAIDTLIGEPLSRLMLSREHLAHHHYQAVVSDGEVVVEPERPRPQTSAG